MRNEGRGNTDVATMLESFREAPGNWWERSRRFLSEVRNELSRVTWPSSREVYATTLVVIVTSIFFGIYLYGLDLVFDIIVRWIFVRFA
jgi:preprotein translocase subunit SecE